MARARSLAPLTKEAGRAQRNKVIARKKASGNYKASAYVKPKPKREK